MLQTTPRHVEQNHFASCAKKCISGDQNHQKHLKDSGGWGEIVKSVAAKWGKLVMPHARRNLIATDCKGIDGSGVN